MTSDPPNGPPERTTAEKFARLRAILYPIGGTPRSFRDISRGLHELGVSLSASYLQEIESGKKKPRQDKLDGLASYFGVRPGYWNDPEAYAQVDAELERIAARHRDTGLQELALRTASLDEPDRAALAALVQNHLRNRSQSGETGPGGA